MKDGSRRVAVAVPLPLPEPLVYTVAGGAAALVAPGARVRVPVGKRRLVGFVTAVDVPAPEGVRLRPVQELLDHAPVLTPDLLELARFVGDYYLAPPGEVLRAMLPADVEPWGRQRARLTSGGALAVPRDATERAVVERLREAGAVTVAELATALEADDLPATLERMAEEGRLILSGARATGGRARYREVVELPGRPVEDLLAACGRSAPGRGVVELLAGAGRPLPTDEVLQRVGCGRGVVKRLVDLGVVRRYTELQRLDLGREALPAEPAGPAFELRPDQQGAVRELERAVAAGRYAPFLLSGVTGSGKTEVYLRAADAALAAGRSVLLLVPEIALVPAMAREARRRFGPRLAFLHSSLSPPERRQEWERIRNGLAPVVLGPRSAVFAPVPDLGLVVVDEEHDSAYKQDATPRYHGRDLALVRAQDAGAVAVLASATPSLESRHNAAVGKLAPLELTARVSGARLPEGILVDLRREQGGRQPGEVTFSAPLLAEIERSLAAGEQVVLLRNRRGYSPVLLCRACGEDHRCEDCGLPRTLHRGLAMLQCHYCGSRLPVPASCRTCGEAALEPLGAGTERVEERFRDLFPETRVAVLDRDTVRRPGGAAAVLERFGRGDVQVLIGTQMVAKGHHFPEVGLAAVLAADSYLGFPDFRAVERTYSLLTQLAGRAGRGERPGRVVLQTYHPDHYAIQAVLAHDDERFAAEELRFRRVFHYPPYTRMVALLVRAEKRDEGEAAADELARRLGRHPLARGLRVTGPAPAPLERLRGRWRFQILLRGPSGSQLRQLVREAAGEGSGLDLVVDVDPQDLM